MSKLVSIIIPSYNNEKTIGNTIESILKQTYKNLEVIIINDGSTDSTLKVLNEYKKKDNRVRVFSQLNSGPGKARNLGIEKMEGDYVTFVDADDIIGEKIIGNLVEVIEEKQTDVVRYNFYYSTIKNQKEQRGSLLNLAGHIFKGEDLKRKLIPMFIKNELCSFVCLLFTKKEIIKKMNFDVNTNYMEDTLFYIDLLYKIKSIFFLDKAEYFYYYTPQSNQNSIEFINKYLKSLNYVYERMNEIVKKNEIENLEKFDLINIKWLNTIIDYLTLLLRANERIKFIDFKNEILKLKFNKSLNFNALTIKGYNKISIKLLISNRLKMLYIFTKFRNIIKKIIE